MENPFYSGPNPVRTDLYLIVSDAAPQGADIRQGSDSSLSISILQVFGKQMRGNVMLTTCFTISIKSTTGMGQKLSPNAHKELVISKQSV